MPQLAPAEVATGLEICLEDPPALLDGARFGLLLHQASVDRQYRYACDLFADRFTAKRSGDPPLRALFSPQHGIWGEQQANMVETPHGFDRRRSVPIYSLYSDRRQPTPEMLRELDVLVIDLQDVGTRVYTYIWTVVHCLEACAKAGVKVLILDRPNPLGGVVLEGPRLDLQFRSFVGLAPIPMRHGLTLAELARLCNRWLGIECELEVVPLRGWQRDMMFPDTGLPWVAPSPNMPRFETAVAYPGQVLLEGTNLSEGRGTTFPFQVVGAPYVDPFQLLSKLPDTHPMGVWLRPIYFRPTSDKWEGQSCGGLAWHWPSADAVRSYAVTVGILRAIRQLWPGDFQWSPPPYEYELEKPPIDILSGSSILRRWIDSSDAGTTDPRQLEDVCQVDSEQWWQDVRPFLLY